MTEHAFTFGSHPRARRLWTWRCSCGEHCRGRLMGKSMDWLPFAEAAERALVHLVALEAEVVEALL